MCYWARLCERARTFAVRKRVALERVRAAGPRLAGGTGDEHTASGARIDIAVFAFSHKTQTHLLIMVTDRPQIPKEGVENPRIPRICRAPSIGWSFRDFTPEAAVNFNTGYDRGWPAHNICGGAAWVQKMAGCPVFVEGGPLLRLGSPRPGARGPHLPPTIELPRTERTDSILF